MQLTVDDDGRAFGDSNGQETSVDVHLNLSNSVVVLHKSGLESENL
jgi:hypothetical protein